MITISQTITRKSHSLGKRKKSFKKVFQHTCTYKTFSIYSNSTKRFASYLWPSLLASHNFYFHIIVTFHIFFLLLLWNLDWWCLSKKKKKKPQKNNEKLRCRILTLSNWKIWNRKYSFLMKIFFHVLHDVNLW